MIELKDTQLLIDALQKLSKTKNLIILIASEDGSPGFCPISAQDLLCEINEISGHIFQEADLIKNS